MYHESESTASILPFQLQANEKIVKKTAQTIKNYKPKHIYTCGRGSSKNAGHYAELLLSKILKVPSSPIKLHEHSINKTIFDYSNSIVIAISQSGKSRDILQAVTMAKKHGAMVIAFVNNTKSPLADLADIIIPIHAGEEKSVAATKTFTLTLTAIAHLASYLSESNQLLSDLTNLSEQLASVWELDWSNVLSSFHPSHSSMIISRDIGLPIAQEAAIKLIETCGIHAEAYSSAEIRHGPLRLLDSATINIFGFAVDNAAAESILSVIELARSLGVTTDLISKVGTEVNLPYTADVHPDLEPILMIHRFYKLINQLALINQLNPDKPPLLNKVTSTL
jgi:glucosamine--fructose-6-phosphate aminotransferase (isomerizing)